MKFSFYDDAGKRLSNGTTLGPGGTPVSGGGAVAAYDKMDVGILALQQVMPSGNIYDFRVPGDPNNLTFKYRMPSPGFVFGVTFTGTINTTGDLGVYLQRFNASNGNGDDVMGPNDPNNKQTYVPTDFANKGMRVRAPAPIQCQADDLLIMKLVNLSAGSLTVNMAGFLNIGLTPQ